MLNQSLSVFVVFEYNSKNNANLYFYNHIFVHVTLLSMK